MLENTLTIILIFTVAILLGYILYLHGQIEQRDGYIKRIVIDKEIEISNKWAGLLTGWSKAIRQQNKAIRRKNKIIHRLRSELING